MYCIGSCTFSNSVDGQTACFSSCNKNLGTPTQAWPQWPFCLVTYASVCASYQTISIKGGSYRFTCTKFKFVTYCKFRTCKPTMYLGAYAYVRRFILVIDILSPVLQMLSSIPFWSPGIFQNWRHLRKHLCIPWRPLRSGEGCWSIC